MEASEAQKIAWCRSACSPIQSSRGGFMKMLIGKDSDEILGFKAFGTEARELLAAVQTAMTGRMSFTILRDAIFTHPTISEGLLFLLGQVESRKG
jgi:pyruvate/2-oxoglutarate dehydrogenase complex dihydrolipoamide dehydrogenase (E3) component